MYNTKQIDKQIEWVKSTYKPIVEESQSAGFPTPQYLHFFNQDELEPMAVLALPPFESYEHKQLIFKAAFSSYKIFETEAMLLSSDVWMNGMPNDEYEKWMKEGKSLSDNPASKSAMI